MRLVRESQASTDAAKALTEEQLEKAKSKKPFGKGLLNPPSIIERWVVMDGGINVSLSELLHPVTKRGTRKLTLANGEQLIIPSCLSMVLETTDLSQVSPAMVSDCAVLHFGNDVVQWRSLLDSWLGEVKTMWDCSSTNFQLLNTLINDTLPATLDFFSQSGSTFILETDQTSSEMSKSLAPGLREISSFTRIVGALFDIYFKRDDGINQDSKDEKEVPESKLSATSPSLSMSSRQASCNTSVLISSIFVFAYVWGFGGHLHDRYWEKFEAFARHILSRCSVDILVPSDGSIFDYHVDPRQGILVPFADKSQEKVKTLPSGYTVIPQMERYSHLVDLLLPTCPVVLCGPPGVGNQSMLEESLVSKLRPMSVALNPSLSNKTATAALTNILPMFFFDDLNCCSKPLNRGGIPNLELMRQLLSQGGFYNHSSLTFQMLEHFKLLGVCTPSYEPGVGMGHACHPLSPRLTRLMTVLNFTSPDVETVLAMHCCNLTNWLEEFPAYSLAHHQELAKVSVMLLHQRYWLTVTDSDRLLAPFL
ncbi:Dynein heavy chain domain-containing protein 1 [Holothuria leucospilota]|uniref:Dynein heavy chain domain-containing protein 1 n=1 Tax=Holothuria leucospilota TaxID=206669 RepID=A0A9Q0YKV6_HOLLE|nr:Dynein heavy chain domain-containing protein 1 [Holothuria leucospilota]